MCVLNLNYSPWICNAIVIRNAERWYKYIIDVNLTVNTQVINISGNILAEGWYQIYDPLSIFHVRFIRIKIIPVPACKIWNMNKGTLKLLESRERTLLNVKSEFHMLQITNVIHFQGFQLVDSITWWKWTKFYSFVMNLFHNQKIMVVEVKHIPCQ